jgi:hypothetical protein
MSEQHVLIEISWVQVGAAASVLVLLGATLEKVRRQSQSIEKLWEAVAGLSKQVSEHQGWLDAKK